MNRIRITALLMLVLFMLVSCSKTPAPEASFTVSVQSNVVTFTVTATNASAFEWDFGDGSSISTEKDPVHTYTRFDQRYEVSLKVKGPGGETTVRKTVTIPPMTTMQMLSGTDPGTAKKWHLSSILPIYFTLPDTNLAVIQTFPAGFLNQLGFTSVYCDEYLFGAEGSFSVSLKENGIIGGLSYCNRRGIPNIVPSQAARENNLTLITPFSPTASMTYGLNEGKDLKISALVNGQGVDVTFRRVSTISLSYGGFIGIKDVMNEFILKDFSESNLTLVCFTSSSPSGKITGALIFTLEPVR